MKLTLWQELAALALGVCAITLGCSSDNVASVLAPTTGTTVTGVSTTGAAVASTALTPVAANAGAQASGRGTPDDASSAAHAADAVWAVLAGGALDAADVEGGAIDDPDFATAAARAHGRRAAATTAPVTATAAAAPSSSLLIPEAIATLQDADPGGVSAQVSGNGVRFTSSGGIDVQASGISATLDTTGAGPAAVGASIDGLSLDDNQRLLGTLGQGARPEVDLRFAGVSGLLGRSATGGNAIDLTIASPGVTVGGILLGARIDATFSGLHGHFTDLAKLDQRLLQSPLQLHVASVVAKDSLDALSGELAVADLVLPQRSGQSVTFGISGSLVATLSARHPLARTGRVGRLNVSIDANTPLTMRGLEGPLNGTATVELVSPDGKVHDQLTYAYAGGVASISGTRTNASGDAERVTSAGDVRSAAGSVAMSDGSRAEHQLDVRHSHAGRRITFRFLTKDAAGLQLLAGDGVVHADRSVTGTWMRPAPHAGEGTFEVTSDGELDLIASSGVQIAHTQLRDGWNALLQ